MNLVFVLLWDLTWPSFCWTFGASRDWPGTFPWSKPWGSEATKQRGCQTMWWGYTVVYHSTLLNILAILYLVYWFLLDVSSTFLNQMIWPLFLFWIGCEKMQWSTIDFKGYPVSWTKPSGISQDWLSGCCFFFLTRDLSEKQSVLEDIQKPMSISYKNQSVLKPDIAKSVFSVVNKNHWDLTKTFDDFASNSRHRTMDPVRRRQCDVWGHKNWRNI